MARRSSDAPKPKNAAPRAALSPAQVMDYLGRHPDFLMQHPELLDGQMAPGRKRGAGIADLQQFMVERLRRDISRLRSEQDELLANARDNLSTQERMHRAALALLAAQSREQLIEIVATDLAVLLDVDAVGLCIEGGAEHSWPFMVEGIHRVPAGTVDRLLGEGRDALLRDETEGDAEIFGPAAGLVRSDALLRLCPSPRAPVGLIAFGTRHPGYFNAGQGTELLIFLKRVLETCVRQWLDPPA
jgi:uncharacterized protein YigA (DUF484 family)